ncbi:hypothetical protein BASA61_007213 [Batrachochytrium salamandrivorans]|nr:hypothetical protein BASA60_005018 [Batrachochytrium salamandrivorans]KAH6577757.1 hypothetical protein BASA62_000738 [Batrachochytrium salamandrivorans]KAH6584845.1 hypothetical protein BASA61_007213 [Batrachochytrium salamandrivorans]
MGRVTVLVQHAWAMQTTTSSGVVTQSPLGADRNVACQQYRSVNTKNNLLPSDPAISAVSGSTGNPCSSKAVMGSLIRLTVPSSVAHLVELYNSAQTAAQRRTCELTVCDTLARLEHLVLASTIPDRLRKDWNRSRISPILSASAQGILHPIKTPLQTIEGMGSNTICPLRRGRRQDIQHNTRLGTDPSFTRRQMPLHSLGTQKLTAGDSPSAPYSYNIAAKRPSRYIHNETAVSKTTRFASEARLSVLMLTRCKTQRIRDHAIDLLLESLDTNALSTTPEELHCLQHLWTELAHIFRSVVDDRRRCCAVGDRPDKPAMALSNSGHPYTTHAPISRHDSSILTDYENHDCNDSSPTTTPLVQTPTQDHGISEFSKDTPETTVGVDRHLEKMLSCLLLTMHRIEFARDMNHFELGDDMNKSFHTLIEDLQRVHSYDPYVIQLTSSIDESIKFVMSMHEYSEEVMAFPVGISFLSQILRTVVPDNISTMHESFLSIMTDLSEKRQWHLGRKFICILATAGMLSQEACLLFVRFVCGLDAFTWKWKYLGVVSFGAIACASEFSAIRRIAIEEGLLPYTKKGLSDDLLKAKANTQECSSKGIASASCTVPLDSPHYSINDPFGDTSPDCNTWTIRAASIVALMEIYQHYGSQPYGLLARETIRNHRSLEPNSAVQKLLCHPAAIAPQITKSYRQSFLLKYICISLAETYADTQSDHMYLRKYVRSAERVEFRRKGHQKGPGNTLRCNDLWDSEDMQQSDIHVHGALHQDFDMESMTEFPRNQPFTPLHCAAISDLWLPVFEAAHPSTRSPINRIGHAQRSESEFVPLSILPYHDNHKKVVFDPSKSYNDVFEAYMQGNNGKSLKENPSGAACTTHIVSSSLLPHVSRSILKSPKPVNTTGCLGSGTTHHRNLFSVDRASLSNGTHLSEKSKSKQDSSIGNRYKGSSDRTTEILAKIFEQTHHHDRHHNHAHKPSPKEAHFPFIDQPAIDISNTHVLSTK